jgi:Xaa-Pro aminopeptidase
MDGQDHQLIANMQKLGPVKVPRGKIQYQQSNPMLNILAARQKNTDLEDEANNAQQASGQVVGNAVTMKNRLNAQSVIALLDERKECKSRREVEQLAVSYDIDIKALDQLARWVNSPSIEAGASPIRRGPVNLESSDDVSASA